MASLAGPFNILREVTGTINEIRGGVRATQGAVDDLSNVLGIDGKASNSDDPTEQVLDIYQSWYQNLAAPDKEIVSWLVMQYARNQQVTFENLSSTEWFLQKSLQDQQKVGGLFFKVNQIVEATGGEKNRFLAFAFCVNGGGQECK
jgi:hypothetical protein